MVLRRLFLCLSLFHLPLLAAETFCYDTPDEGATTQPVLVAGQHIYGQHTARIAGWVLQQLPQATFINLPWQRCLAQVKAGRMTGLLSMGWTAERAKAYQFPLHAGQPDRRFALYEVPYHIFVHRNSKLQWDGQRFIGLQYGLITMKGYLTEHRLRELNALSPLDLDLNLAVDLVVNQRIDGYVIPQGTTFQQFLQHPAYAQIRQLQQPLLSMPLYLVFYPQYCQEDPLRCQRVWQHLAQRRAEFQAAQTQPAKPAESSQ